MEAWNDVAARINVGDKWVAAPEAQMAERCCGWDYEALGYREGFDWARPQHSTNLLVKADPFGVGTRERPMASVHDLTGDSQTIRRQLDPPLPCRKRKVIEIVKVSAFAVASIAERLVGPLRTIANRRVLHPSHPLQERERGTTFPRGGGRC